MAALYLAIYAFHMPLFAFLSGRFSSAGPGTTALREARHEPGRAVPGLQRHLVRPAPVVQGDARLDLAAPYQHLWFLVALFAWRLALPLVAALRYPLTASVLVA